jgi:hypothetical protein
MEFARAKTIRVPGPLPVATGETNNSQILAKEGELPLVLERDKGCSNVYIIVFDKTTSPFDAWEGITSF